MGGMPQCQVRARLGRPQERLRGAPAPAGALVDFEVVNAFVVAAVEVPGPGNASLNAGAGKILQNGPFQPLMLDPPLTAVAVVIPVFRIGVAFFVQPVVIFMTHKVGKAVIP